MTQATHSGIQPAQGPAEHTPPAPAPSARKGAAWTLGGFLFSNILKLGSNFILARLLYPEAFGLVALVMTFTQGLAVLSDVGIHISLVQNPRADEPRFRDTVWTVQVLRGITLWVLCCAIAWPVAAFYDLPQLTWLLPCVGLMLLVGGFDSTSVFIAQRHLQLKSVALMDLVAGLSGSVVTISVALAHRAVFGPHHPSAVAALAAGICFSAVVRLAFSHYLLPFRHRHRFALSRDVLKEMFRIGSWIFVSSALTFLVGQLDRLTFAKMIPLSLFGVYGIAMMLSTLPQLAVGHVARAVGAPMLARVAHDVAVLKATAARLRRPLLLGAGTLVAGLMSCGPLLTTLIYDDRYRDAGWILRLLTVGVWFGLLEAFNSVSLIAQGRTRWIAAGSAAKLAALLVALPLGFHLDGFRGALIGIIVSEVLRYAVTEFGLTLTGIRNLRVDLLFTVGVFATAWAGIAAGEFVQESPLGLVAAFFAAGLTTAALWAVAGGQYLLSERARKRAEAEAGAPVSTPTFSSAP